MMTKSISDLAREAGAAQDEGLTYFEVSDLQRFHDLAIAQYRESLLAVVGGPDTHCFDDDTGKDVWSYSKDQLAAAVAIERERSAKVCERRYMGDNNREDIEAKACAAAIRGQT